MKKFNYLIALTFVIFSYSCGSNDDSTSNSLIGKWNFENRYDNNGNLESTDDCERQSNVTFKSDNTFDLVNYMTINLACTQTDNDQNVEYSFDGSLLQITFRSTDSGGATTIDISKLQVTFTNNDTIELVQLDQNGNPENTGKEVWVRR